MAFGMNQQKSAVLSGYWPLMRYNPALRAEGKNPFQLDSKAPSIPLKQYAYQEARYTMLARSNPEAARELLQLAQADVTRQWRVYANRASMQGAGVPPTRRTGSWRGKVGERGQAMIDLTTTYLGLGLKNPLVASASPLCDSLDKIRGLEDHGIAAVVLPSLFEEQLAVEGETLDEDLFRGSDSFAESLDYFPDLATYNLGPDGYLNLIRQAKASISIPVIGSLNGVSAGGWIRYAREIEQAGADALELNLYSIETDPELSASNVERAYIELVREVKQSVKIPVAVKLSPFFSAPANFANRLDRAGANALVLFNRFYQPDLDLEQLEVVPSLSLSHPAGTAAATALDCDHLRARRSRPRGHRRCAQRARSFESHDGGGACHHDDFGVAAQRHRSSRSSIARSGVLDGGA